MTDDYDAAKDGHDSYYAGIAAKKARGQMGDWEDRPARDKARFWQESNVQVQIVKALRTLLPAHYRVVSIPNGRFKADPRTIGRLKREGLTPGVWDLMVLRSDGWFCAIEVKAGAGKLSPEQVEWGDWLGAGGASTAVVRSVEEALEALEAFGVPLRGHL